VFKFVYLYFIFILLFILVGSYRYVYRKRFKPNLKDQFATIVVPARNEEKDVADLIECLIAQEYPKDMYEILIVNDRSTDRTEEIIKGYAEKYPNVNYITITETNPNLMGKQNALDFGIRAAKGEIILLTDADCIIGKHWVKNMVKMFNSPDVGLVVGKTEIYEPKTFWDRFQVLFHRLNIEIAQVSIMVGKYTSGMGNNLGVSKSAYISIGGYPKLGKSILDDEILVRGVAKAGYDLRAAVYKDSIVHTKPMPDLKSLQKQHIRWIDGGLHYKSPTRIGIILYYIFNLYMIYLLIVGIVFLDYYAFACVVVKILSDFLYMFQLDSKHDERHVRLYEDFLFAIIMPYYVFWLTTKSLFFRQKIEWKAEVSKRSKRPKR